MFFMMNFRGLLSAIFGAYTPTRSVDSSSHGSGLTFIGPTLDDAADVSTVYSAAKLIGEGVARLPLTVQRYNYALGKFVRDYNNPLYDILRLCPNAYMTSFDMWRSAIQQVLLKGNAYMLPTRDIAGEVIELTLLSPNSVTFDTMAKVYRIQDTVHNIFRTVTSSEIVHFRNIGIDGGYTGLSTVQLAARALGILRLSDQNTATTLSNGGRMRGILSGAAGAETFGAASSKQLGGVSERIEDDIRSGRTVIPVPEDMKFQTITLSPADARVLESKQITIRDLARYFRVHPDLLYEGTNNTYKAAEVPNVMFLTQTLEPLLVQIERELLVKLVPRSLWGKRLITFDREVMYTTDLLTEADYFGKMLQTGVYTVNDLRAKKGQSPINGGDKLLVSANLRPLDAILQEAADVNKNNNNTEDNGEEETNV